MDSPEATKYPEVQPTPGGNAAPSLTPASLDFRFGRLAVATGIVEQETLDRAIQQRVAEGSKSLADILVQVGALSEKSRQAIDVLLEAHVAKNGNNPQQSLSSWLAPSTDSQSAKGPDDTVAFVPKPGNGQYSHRRFGDYELMGEIARGGMGVVYTARQAKLNRLVALKMIRSGELADEAHIKRFYSEAEAAAKLDHPGIVPVYEVGEANGQHYFSMALVVGTSLNDCVKNDGPLPPKEAARLLKTIVEAVEYAHGKGVIHRDIKPQNILLDEAGQPRLTDFGLAKHLKSQSELTATGQVMGTPSFMPPEQARGKLDEIGPASDVYSLGATLYFVLTGRPPFQTASVAETIQQVLHAEPVGLRRLNPAIPRDLETICLKCLRKDPAKRYATAAEFAADLARWLENRPIVARPVGRPERVFLWCKRRPALVGLSAAFLMLTVAGSFIAFERQNAIYAAGLVAELESAEIAQVPGIVERMKSYRRWAGPLLDRQLHDSEDGSNLKLHTALALLPVDEDQSAYLRDQLLVASPSQFPVVRDALSSHREHLVEPLWRVSLDETERIQPRFQAACALATYSPEDDRWSKIDKRVTEHLVTRQASEMVAWRQALRPAKDRLTRSLGAIYRDITQREQPRAYAAETLAEYAAHQPKVLVDFLADAEWFQFPVILERLDPKEAIPLAALELAKLPAELATEDEKEQIAKRRANLAVALVQLGATEQAWPLLVHAPDPRARTYFIHWLGPLGADPKTVIKRLEVESNNSIRRGLVLALGEFSESQYPPESRKRMAEMLQSIYETEPDAGLHAAAEWLLRKWGESERLVVSLEKLRASPKHPASKGALATGEKQNWYVNSEGQTMIILDPGEFIMGSPLSEPDRLAHETQHRRKIGWRFAIAAHEVTKAQFAVFQGERPEIAESKTSQWVTTDDSPQSGMSWYEAAAYCNWLSQRDGLTEDQWVYEPNADKKYAAGMKAKPKADELVGYRLPSEGEWEYACRAWAVTSRYYGPSEWLLPKYAWHMANSVSRTRPVGSLKPNDFGSFDMLGNVFEWTNERYVEYPILAQQEPGSAVVSLDDLPVSDTKHRVVRGGSFNNAAPFMRSASRHSVQPTMRTYNVGFRVARTHSPAP